MRGRCIAIYPGQYEDSETGLYYNWHRYYDPETGRYLMPDPIGLAGGINPFLYAESNPINLIDPEGLSPAGWIVKLTNKGVRKIKKLKDVASASRARRQGKKCFSQKQANCKAN